MVAMEVGLEAELTATLGAFNILTPFSFSFMGEPATDASSISTAAGWTGAPTEANPEQLLARAIQASLYNRCYAHRLGDALDRPDWLPVEDADFARRLAEANAGRERWDPDWMIYQLGANGQV